MHVHVHDYIVIHVIVSAVKNVFVDFFPDFTKNRSDIIKGYEITKI